MSNQQQLTEKRTDEERLRGERTRTGPACTPEVDIYEMGHDLYLVADIPGAAPDRIQVDFENGQISIRAQVPPRRPEGAQPLLEEYAVVDYHRVFSVSEQIDSKGIVAEYRNGVLVLRLPRLESLKPRRIQIRT